MFINIGDVKLYESCDISRRFGLPESADYGSFGSLSLADFALLSLADFANMTLGGSGNYDLSVFAQMSLKDWADVHFLMKRDSMGIHHRVEERSTAEVTVKDSQGCERDVPWHFEEGQQVTFRDQWADVHFSGIVSSSKEELLRNRSFIWHDVEFADEHYRIDKLIVKGTWQNTMVGDQVRDLLGQYFGAEGIREGEIQDGDVVLEAATNYVHGNEAMDARKEYMGTFTWFVDTYRKLYFIDRTTYACPWTLTHDDTVGVPTVERSSPKYRNVQYIQGSKETTVLQTETKVGDGHNQTFTMRLAIGQEPTVSVSTNGGSTWDLKTVGIRGVESGYDWYWNKEEKEISQDSSGTPLADGNLLKTEYYGLYSVMAKVTNSAEVGLRALTEGIGTGVVEDIIDDSSLNTKEAALDRAAALLAHYSAMGRKFMYRTLRDDGIAAGQLQTIDYPKYCISDIEFLITAIDITEQNDLIYRDVECAEGPVEDSWDNIFCKIASRPQQQIIQENISEGSEVIGLHQFTQAWHAANNPNLFNQVYPGASTYPGTAFWPCVDPDNDAQKYCVLLDAGNNELARIYRTEQTVSGSEVNTTFFVTSDEANGPIAKIRIYGGFNASSTPGSGIIFDEFVFVYQKNSLEALQIEIVDSFS